MKPETRFRVGRIDPFLKFLEKEFKIYFDAIQQVGKVGTPDYYLCVKGKFVGMEVKTDVGRLSPAQALRGLKIVRGGGIFLVVRPKNWIKIQDVLVKLAKGEIHDQNDIPTNF